jgi:hypothetical protein
MKINTNIEGIIAGKMNAQTAGTNTKESNKADVMREKPSQTLQNLSQKRTLVDAVIITQIAQDFFQKAVLISSKLKSLASDAINSGKIKGPELNDTLKDISSLNKIQDGFAATITVQSDTNLNRVGVISEMPQIQTMQTKEDINSLNEFANDLSSGNVNLKKIDRINENLTNKASAADRSFNQLISKFPIPDNIVKTNGGSSVVKYSEVAQNTVSQIEKYPQAALKSQGNINFEVVKNLL